MPSIVSYQKYTDDYTTYTLQVSASPGDDTSEQPTELCTIAGVTYVSVPDTVTIPVQPPEIAASVVAVVVTDELKAQIKAESPHMRLISQRMIDRIRAKYTIDDEMFYARIGVGLANGLYAPTEQELADMIAFGEFVELVRQDGRAQRQALGL